MTSSRTEHFLDHAKGLDVTIERGYAAQHKDDDDDDDNDWYKIILENTRWHRVKYKSNRFGKDCETPCWTTFFGGASPDYQPYTAVPSWLQPLVKRVSNDVGGVPFNAILLRLYLDGHDEIAWHTDGRTFLGPRPVIASLSLGASANFEMRRMNNVWPTHKNEGNGMDRTTQQRVFCLQHGDMLVMRGATQQYWHHRVPQQKGRHQPRVNINFRYIVPNGPDAERGQQTYYKYMVHGDATTPRSFSYAEIMAKRGGIRNYFLAQNRAIKSTTKLAVEVKATPAICTRKTLVDNEQPATADNNSNGNSSATTTNCHSGRHRDCAAYLDSERSVDKETFLSLPGHVQDEIVKEWKQNQTKRHAVAVSHKRIGPKSKRIKGKYTLDSFFGENKE